VHPYIDLFGDLWEYALKYGYDDEHGGFWYTGPFHKPADDRQKSWWVQAEVLVSALYMHRLTGDRKYLEVFDKTWRFIDRYMIDWVHGEWHATVGPDRKAHGDKAHIWKAGYHNGRAMIESIALLR
jgi:mannobiose 2-epimerase